MAVKAAPQETLPEPFIKWAGGKGQLLTQLARYYPPTVKRYFEPFIGSAAVFFDVHRRFHPRYTLLSDTNAELVNCYKVVRDDPEAVIRLLGRHKKLHRERGSGHYYKIRELQTRSFAPAQRAARFIYLNKTCYNGLYRVNSAGQFNVPIGRYKNPNILDDTGLRAASRALQGVRLTAQDFSDCLGKIKTEDFIYIDPPYFPRSATSNFTGYTEGGFGLEQQERLASFARAAGARGCRLMLSNSDTPVVRSLYRGFHIHTVSARRAINSNGRARGPITELVITNYNPEKARGT